MGIFYTSSKPVLPSIKASIQDALMVNPSQLVDPGKEAATRTVALADSTSPQFNALRFAAAGVIAAILLAMAIWPHKDMPDISKALTTSFTGFSGLVLGLLGGEAQKSPSS